MVKLSCGMSLDEVMTYIRCHDTMDGKVNIQAHISPKQAHGLRSSIMFVMGCNVLKTRRHAI